MGAVVLPALLLGALVPAPPWWLLQPATGSTEQLARAIGWRAFPSAPRTISDRNEVEGHCLPTALLDQLQLNGGAGQWPSGRDLSAVEEMRATVCDFALDHQDAPWPCGDPRYPTLGAVVRAVARSRGWGACGVQAWAARLRKPVAPRGRAVATPCDSAFLFAAAACFDVRIHVTLAPPRGASGVTRYTFAAPAGFAARRSRPISILGAPDVHLGFVDERGGEYSVGHFVGAPLGVGPVALPERSPALLLALLAVASAAVAAPPEQMAPLLHYVGDCILTRPAVAETPRCSPVRGLRLLL